MLKENLQEKTQEEKELEFELAPFGRDYYGTPYTEEDARSSYDDDRLHAMREGD
jgi:hypothetical protein